MMRPSIRFGAALVATLLAGAAPASADDPKASGSPDGSHALMRFPNQHGSSVTFVAHGNLWVVDRAGGVARRLTTDAGPDLMPRYSPDGKWIAFTANYQGNQDVYVIPAQGGAARRLTFHSDITEHAPTRWGPDNMVVTWTPDSQAIIFLSRRKAWNSWITLPFSVPLAGGLATQMPLDRAGFMTYGPDGHSIAYTRIFRDFRTWKRYGNCSTHPPDGDVFEQICLILRASRLINWPNPQGIGVKMPPAVLSEGGRLSSYAL